MDKNKLLEMPCAVENNSSTWPSNEQIITARATAILRNSDATADVALRLLSSVNFKPVDTEKFWVVLPYYVNLACCYHKLGHTAKAYECLAEASKLIDTKFLQTKSAHTVSRAIRSSI